MKRKILIGLGILVIILVGFALYVVLVVNKRSPAGTTSISANGVDVKVEYHRPHKKGRLIFGDKKDGALQPYGVYWRLGANEATEITFNKNINFAGKPVKAGTYRMYTIPGPEIWSIFLNSELGKWGYSEANHTLNVLKADVAADNTAPETEQFVINLSSDSAVINMDFVWDKTLVRVPITVQ